MVVPVHGQASDSNKTPLVGAVIIPKPADTMNTPDADATLSGLITATKTFTANYPHEAQGENAHALAFFRDLRSRDLARLDAENYGQVLRDRVSEARFTPAPEAFVLRQIQNQTRLVLDIYERALTSAGLMLTTADQQTVDQLRGQLHPV